MNHYSIEDWADFARRSLGPRRIAAMEKHLARGCKECVQARSMWQSVIELASKESSYAPPDDVVRSAKAAFILARPEKKAHWLSAMAEVVFDSFRAPLLEGVRASRAGDRQMLYQHGNKSVHIRVQHDATGDHYSLVGQVLDTKNPERPVRNVPVRLRTPGEKASRMKTNDFGEFHFEVDALDQVGIEIGRQFRVMVPLSLSKGPTKATIKTGNEN
jgi:hypothetical protein